MTTENKDSMSKVRVYSNIGPTKKLKPINKEVEMSYQ